MYLLAFFLSHIYSTSLPLLPSPPLPQSQTVSFAHFSIYVYSSLNSINSSIVFFDLCRKKSFYKIEININFWFSENIQTLRLVLAIFFLSGQFNSELHTEKGSICKVIDYTLRILFNKLKFSQIYRIFKLLCFCC